MPTALQNDILLLHLEASIVEGSVTGGTETWAAVADSPQTVGSGAGLARAAIYWARASQDSPTSPTVGAPSNHIQGAIISYQDCITTGNPWDVTSGGTEAGPDTSVSITGDTTTVVNCLIVLQCSTSLPDTDTTTEFGSMTNADLGSLTDRIDSTNNDGNGGGLFVGTGTKAAAGTYGATTLTAVTSAAHAFISIALKSASVISEADGASTGTGVATGVGLSTATADGLAAGLSTPLGVGQSIPAADAAAAGAATVSADGASIQSGVGASDGTATASADGQTIFAAVGASDGLAVVSGIGLSTATADGASDGTSTVSGVGQSSPAADGTSDGTGAAAGVGLSTATADGASDGTSTVSGVGLSTATADGASDGTSTASGEGDTVGGGSDGVAAGIATVAGVGASVMPFTGSSAAIAEALGIVAKLFAGMGNAAGTATVLGEAPSAAPASPRTPSIIILDPARSGAAVELYIRL
jgi:hypothetical protein